MHIKKTKMPRSWPVPRKGKGKRFVAVPSHAGGKGISILFLLRDILGIVKTKKEARYMTLNEMVKVNGVVRKDENFPVQVFDSLNLSPRDGSADPDKGGKNYRLEIVNKKFSLSEISAKDAETKIIKISGKKTLGKNKVQMNLDDGQNILVKEKFSVGDSVVFNVKGNKVEKILPLKKGAKVEVVAGKHAGEKGELVGVKELTRGSDYEIKLEDKTVSLPYRTILVIA